MYLRLHYIDASYEVRLITRTKKLMAQINSIP